MKPHPHHKVLMITSVGVNVLYLCDLNDPAADLTEHIVEVPHELLPSGLTDARYVKCDIRRLWNHAVRTLDNDDRRIEVPGQHVKLPLYEEF